MSMDFRLSAPYGLVPEETRTHIKKPFLCIFGHADVGIFLFLFCGKALWIPGNQESAYGCDILAVSFASELLSRHRWEVEDIFRKM